VPNISFTGCYIPDSLHIFDLDNTADKLMAMKKGQLGLWTLGL